MVNRWQRTQAADGREKEGSRAAKKEGLKPVSQGAAQLEAFLPADEATSTALTELVTW